MTAEAFEKKYTVEGNPYFQWLTADRTRAKLSRNFYQNRVIGLSIFERKVTVQEAIVDFVDGKLNLLSLSIYNRGDGGDISKEDFTTRFTVSGKAMSELLRVAALRKEAKPEAGLLTAGYSWHSRERGTALLEHNDQAMSGGNLEFLRLRVAQPNAKGALAGSMTHSRGGTATGQGDLPKNLIKTDKGDIFISRVPMVDQGAKGYCLCASVQRVFEYFGIGADMHQIAQITNADASKGTKVMTMADELGKIDYRFKTRLDVIGMANGEGLVQVEIKKDNYYQGSRMDERKFLKEIFSHIDKGLPLLWALELGRFPENPLLNPQTSGGHMRLIIGYNEKEKELLFSDSWGAGHELKRMNFSYAYRASLGLFVLKPTSH